ncbi:hypothetical protein A176_003570 [Myxococcus hansupus]|uniref:Uncharacterized protein n=1 Tax=Pseudomyxococcus hansupus TaxID=1297742 RepID=A0A0H4WYH4_9BACT|nr:hypothetical protein A176_003570 [Myxococcus hansupus]
MEGGVRPREVGASEPHRNPEGGRLYAASASPAMQPEVQHPAGRAFHRKVMAKPRPCHP